MIGSSHIVMVSMLEFHIVFNISLSPYNGSVTRTSLEVHQTSREDRRRDERTGEERKGGKREDEWGESAMLVSIFNRRYRRPDCPL